MKQKFQMFGTAQCLESVSMRKREGREQIELTSPMRPTSVDKVEKGDVGYSVSHISYKALLSQTQAHTLGSTQ